MSTNVFGKLECTKQVTGLLDSLHLRIGKILIIITTSTIKNTQNRQTREVIYYVTVGYFIE